MVNHNQGNNKTQSQESRSKNNNPSGKNQYSSGNAKNKSADDRR